MFCYYYIITAILRHGFCSQNPVSYLPLMDLGHTVIIMSLFFFNVKWGQSYVLPGFTGSLEVQLRVWVSCQRYWQPQWPATHGTALSAVHTGRRAGGTQRLKDPPKFTWPRDKPGLWPPAKLVLWLICLSHHAFLWRTRWHICQAWCSLSSSL